MGLLNLLLILNPHEEWDLQIWHFVGCSTKGAHHSEESEGLKFNFPWGISFFLCLEKTKSNFL